jgi:hypothetical protein
MSAATADELKEALAALKDPIRRREILQQEEEASGGEPAPVSEEARVRFALPPAWTRTLVDAVGFPEAAPASPHLCDRLHGAGWAQLRAGSPSARRRRDSASAEDVFWMDPVRRQRLLEEVIRDSRRGRAHVVSQLADLGQALLEARARGVPMPEVTADWATFAVDAGQPHRIAQRLERRIAESIERGQAGEARRWLEVVRRLDTLLEGQLSAALGYAERQVDLLYRRQDDERRLAGLQLREEQLRAFARTLEGPDEQWGLHFIGSGGVGKTMLMRYLSARLGPERRMSTARVDFDHLDPSYPTRQPGLLLRQLGEELQLHDRDGTATKLFGDCARLIESIHEELSSTRESPEQLRGKGLFQQLVSMFAEAMRYLPQPVVILLDTCEELARIDVGLGGAKNVEETFAVLELLVRAFREGAAPQAKLRIIFSGRGPLAKAGAGWRLEGDSPLQERSYLRLHEVRGFQEEEARRFLLDNQVPEELVGPILEKSQDLSQPPPLSWAAPSERPADVPRFLPYQLALYARLLDEERLDARRIQETTFEEYLSLRIIERLRSSEAERLLPAAALLGEFTRATLRKLWQGEEEGFERGLAALSWQEWVESPDSERRVLQPRLRRQLERYYAAAQPEELERSRRIAIEHLEQLTLEHPLNTSELKVGDFSVLLRLMADQPQRLARWWKAVELRLAGEDIDWLKTITARWLGEDQAARDLARDRGEQELPMSSPIQAALIAAHCAARINTEGVHDVSAEWREVERLSADYPDPREGERLLWRARAGQIAPIKGKEQVYSFGEVWGLIQSIPREALDEQLGASVIAAIERLLEFVESGGSLDGAARAPGGIELVARGLASTSEPLQSFAWALTGRAHRRWGVREESIRCFQEAVRLCPMGGTRQRWLDWKAPEDVGARVRLEAIRALYPDLWSPMEVLGLVRADRQEFDSLDKNRLQSAEIMLLSQVGAPTAAMQIGVLNLAVTSPSFNNAFTQPVAFSTCAAHRGFPPLSVTLAEVAASDGRLTLAREALSVVRGSAEAVSNVEVAGDADRAQMRIATRMRLWDALSLTRTSSSKREKHLRAVVSPPIRLEAQGRPSYPPGADTPDAVHEDWRALFACTPQTRQETLAWAHKYVLPALERSARLPWELGLDCIEARLLERQGEGRSPSREKSFSFEPLREELGSLDALTLALRADALDVAQSQLTEAGAAWLREPSRQEQLAKRIGRRSAAELALEEGELLALRLPRHAARMLQQALRWFHEVSDPIGALRAECTRLMACARAGVSLHADAVARRTLDAEYEACRERVEGLPSWVVLEVGVIQRDFNLSDAAATAPLDPLWRPWLVRIQACIAWLHGDREAMEGLLQASQDALGGTEPPAELTGWFAARRGHVLLNLSLAHRQPDRRFLRADALQFKNIPPEAPAEPSAAPATRAPTEEARGRALTLSIRCLEPIAPLELRPRGMEVRLGQASHPVRVSALTPYPLEAANLPAPLIQQLTKLLTPQEAPVRVGLNMDEPAMGICWEGLVSLALEKELPAGLPLPDFFRSASELKQRSRPWAPPGIAATLIFSLPQGELAARAWEPYTRARGGFHQVVWIKGAVTLEKLPRELEVLHLIGSPVRGARGVRMQPASEESRHDSNAERKNWISAFDLGTSLRKLSVCILQDVPGFEAHRTSSDRERPALLRLYAAELHQMGIPLVMTIPALPPELARLALERISSVLHERNVTDALLGALARIRAELRRQASHPDHPLFESAFDFSLFRTDFLEAP